MSAPLDLVVLVADVDIDQTLDALLQRSQALQIRPVSYRIFRHPMRDNGCRTAALDVLRPTAAQYRHALVVFDREGSGRDALARDQLEHQVEAQLGANGWSGRCAALVLDPEIEIWMWTDSPELDQVIGWAGRKPALREWLGPQQPLRPDGKPARPKEALHAALRHVNKPPSAALFAQLAARAGLMRCTDPTFLKLKATLQRWFPR